MTVGSQEARRLDQKWELRWGRGGRGGGGPVLVKKESESVSSSVMSYPMDCSPPVSSVLGILQARILEWVAKPFSGIFLTQGLNPGLLHCGWILYHLSLVYIYI